MTQPDTNQNDAAKALVIQRGGGRPVGGAYKTSDGKRVPSVSTICSRFGDKSNLVPWAWKRGRDGLELYASRDRACDIGSAVHDAAEAFIVSGAAPLFEELQEDLRSDARDAYSSFARWFLAMNPRIIAVEVPLVSDALKVGGTFDAVGYIGGKLCMLDWKTSSGIFSEYLIQVAGYGVLWEEAHPDMLIEEYHLCRFSKESGAFEHRAWSARKFAAAKAQFLRLVEAYDGDKAVSKLLK